MNLPKRKNNRLSEYDYSTPNAYFITICANKRKNIFWENVGASIARPQDVQLSGIGQIVDGAIREIPRHYECISVDNYVIMPNHLHMLVRIYTGEDGRAMLAPTISELVRQMKGSVSKRLGFSVWQKGFYDHVVRGEKDYLGIWQYIDGNPGTWLEDELYLKD